MSECMNAEIRDRLPELVTGRLTGESLTIVREHVAGCASCGAEVEILEKSRAILVLATPRIDASAIVQALPAPGTQVVSRSMGARLASNWRIAAAITVLALGGGSVAMLRGSHTGVDRADTILAARTQAPTTAAPTGSAVATDGSELVVAGDLSQLTDDQLRDLLGKVEAIDALPAAEPRVMAPLRGVVPEASTGNPTGEME